MQRFSSPVPTLPRQQGETQQMVTSVNFASDCTPVEDVIICGLHVLLLMRYINAICISSFTFFFFFFLTALEFLLTTFTVETSGSDTRASQTQPNMFSWTQLSEVSFGDERENKLSVTSVYATAHLTLHAVHARFRCTYSRLRKHPFGRQISWIGDGGQVQNDKV